MITETRGVILFRGFTIALLRGLMVVYAYYDDKNEFRKLTLLFRSIGFGIENYTLGNQRETGKNNTWGV